MISRTHAWAMWLIASIFYAYQYILRVIPSVMMDDILNNFSIDVSLFGQMSGLYYLGYSLIHLPLGWLLDHYGPKKIMPTFIGLTVLGTLPLIYSDSWIYPVAGRVLVGIGSSAAILGLFKIIRICYAEKYFSRMLSLSVTIGLLGAIYGGGPVHFLKLYLGYKFVLNMLVVAGIILAVVTYFIIPENENSLSENKIMTDIKEVFLNYRVMAVCLLSGLMVGPLEGFADVWGTNFLKVVYVMDEKLAASLPSLIFIGMCFGAPLLSTIAEKTNNYIGTIISCAIFMALSFILILTGKLSTVEISFLFVFIGFLSSYQIIAIYKASTYVKENIVGLTTASANMIIMIFGYFFHSSIGKVIYLFSNKNGSFSYNEIALTYGIAIIPVCLLIAGFGFIIFAIREKK